MRRSGMTLLEVVVALALLSTGVLALVCFQAHALAVQRRVATTRTLVSLVEEEMGSQLLAPTQGRYACRQALPATVEACAVEVVGCTESLDAWCSSSVTAGRSLLVTVRAAALNGEEFELSSLWARFPR